MLGAGEEPLLCELLCEPRDMLFVEAAALLLREALRELAERAPAVDALEQRVHERAELHHLPVCTPDECGALLVAGPVDLAEQLDAFGPVEDGLGRRLDRAKGWLSRRGHLAAGLRSVPTSG